jgi:hypothetical protein
MAIVLLVPSFMFMPAAPLLPNAPLAQIAVTE